MSMLSGRVVLEGCYKSYMSASEHNYYNEDLYTLGCH